MLGAIRRSHCKVGWRKVIACTFCSFCKFPILTRATLAWLLCQSAQIRLLYLQPCMVSDKSSTPIPENNIPPCYKK